MAEKKENSKGKTTKGKTVSGKTADSAAVRSQKEEEKAAGIKKNPAGSQMRDSIISVLLIAFSIFTIIVLMSDTTGQVGLVLSYILKGMLGIVAYGLPFYLIIYAVLMLMQKVAHVNSRTILFTLILILDFAMINSVRFEEIRAGTLSLSFLKQAFVDGIELDSAGVIGMLLGRIFYKLVDIPGLIIFAIVILIICVLLLANTPISQFFDNLRIKRNQKKINALTDRTESGMSDPLKDTIPLPDLPITDQPDSAIGQGRMAILGGKSPKALLSEYLGKKGFFSDKRNTEIAPEEQDRQDSSPSGNGRSIGKTADAVSDAGQNEDLSYPKFRDLFGGFSLKKANTETETIALDNRKQILDYMNDDSIFNEKEKPGSAETESESSVEFGLGASYGDSAGIINNGNRNDGTYSFFETETSDRNLPSFETGIAPDEQAFFDSMKKGLETISESGRKERSTSERKRAPSFTDSSAVRGEMDFPSLDEHRDTFRELSDDLPVSPIAASADPAAGVAAADASVKKGKRKNSGKRTSDHDLSLEEVRKEAEKPPVPAEKVYRLPPVYLLNEPVRHNNTGRAELREKAAMLEKVLQDFGVDARVINVHRGPSITRYEIQPATGVKVSSIVRLSDDIALNLRAKSLRIEAPIPGQAAIGIEVQNDRSDIVSIREMIESPQYQDADSKISFAVGEDITGNTVVADLKKMPHMLIAGSTGSGKSVCINSILMSILYRATPDEVKLILIDPKVVELGNYNGIPHMLIPVVTDPAKASAALMWAVQEMEGRYKKFAKEKVKNLAGFNNKMRKESRAEEIMPQIVIIIDELADLMLVAAKQVEESICRLAQLARAAGMHMIVATQRPSVDVVTGLIKANVPSRIAFAVSSQVDSRTILDRAGAEKLVGNGDMLFSPLGSSHPQRLQGPFVTDDEVTAVIDFWKEQAGDDGVPEQMQQVMQEINTVTMDFGGGDDGEDELYREAVKLVIDSGQASASMLQRRFRIGYNRAGRLIDTMEANGIIGPSEGSRPRKVLVSREEYELENGDAFFDDDIIPEEEE